ncbi:dihydrolipoyl dehydrogenase [Inediibacterium massiliense]|uniref:dihydrolipoyl dehydrogenase n=1 Tax=Inediibacterium massiliense TaxID=1658111 RepID=UPI0006B4250F|nr:dihydrolipoyl dehydrogenase [Inediibacterium massiliense]
MKIAVLGGGPGGYVAAIRAAQLGCQVTLIEKSVLGGTCLNVGCIPTKVLLHSAELFHEIKNINQFGIEVSGETKVNWNQLQNRKKTVVNTLVSGVKSLLAFNKVKVINGIGSFESNNMISVIKEDGEVEKVEFDKAVISTGSIPFVPPIEGKELKGVIDSTDALSLDYIPKSIVIIGGGVIGVEFASIYNAFGCEVTIIEMMPYILPPVDREISELMKGKLIKEGIKIYNNCKVMKIEENTEGLNVIFANGHEQLKIHAQKVLMAVGRKPYINGLNLERVGVRTEKGCIVVNNKMQTNVEQIYAIGDCIGKNMLAHVASEQGIVAAENIMDKNVKMDDKTVPSCVYTKPELASVGLTEEQVKEKGIDYKVGKFPLRANGKSLIMNETLGMIKIIADKKYDEILGVHILGLRATDLITEGALALRLEATLSEIASTIHAHPTIGEAMKEAVLAVNKEAIHMINK